MHRFSAILNPRFRRKLLFLSSTFCLAMMLTPAYANSEDGGNSNTELSLEPQSMAVVLSAEDIKSADVDNTFFLEEKTDTQDVGIEKSEREKTQSQHEAQSQDEHQNENENTENNENEEAIIHTEPFYSKVGDGRNNSKTLEIRRHTQNIGSADSPTIDGGLISAPELVDTLEAGSNLENLSGINDINVDTFSLDKDKYEKIVGIIILAKIEDIFESGFFYNAEKLFAYFEDRSLFYRDILTQNAKTIGSAWFQEMSKTVYARNKLAKSEIASHSRVPKAKNQAKPRRGGAHV